MYICPPSSDQDYDARQVHTSATTPHKEGKHAPTQSTSLDGLTTKLTSQLCPVDTDLLLVNIRPEVNNSPQSLLGLCDFDNKHLCSDIKEKQTLNTRVNELSTVLHQKNSHCVGELSYKSHDKVNNNSCNNIVSESSTNHNFSTTSLNFHVSLNEILKIQPAMKTIILKMQSVTS